jgi:hypothetical protein
MKRVSIAISIVALTITGLWLLGNLISDRWGWSQWLAWIPTPVVLVLLITTLLFTFVSKCKKLSAFVTVIFVTSLLWFVFKENKFFANTTSQQGLKIVGWTMSHPKEAVSKESADQLIKLNGDITLLTHGWHVRGENSIKEWIGKNNKRVISGPFTLLTKLKVIEVRTLIASDGVYISMFTIDTTEQLEKPLVLWAIDLPSSLTTIRMNTASRVRRILDSIEYKQPDVVLGDFNMTRNSYAIKTMFPTLIEASDIGGKGLIASYPANFSLYHIDHILLSKAFNCSSYELINPDIGRHRVQIALIDSKK